MRSAARAFRLAANNSRLLASQIVQVTSEANTSPIMIAFTTMSAPMNIPQGERSRGSDPGPWLGTGTGRPIVGSGMDSPAGAACDASGAAGASGAVDGAAGGAESVGGAA